MHNQTSNRRKASTPARDDKAFWAWRGYEDRRTGLGFAQEYDTLPEWHQRNYERGRQVAAYVGERAVKWRKTELLASLLRRTGGYTLSGEVSADVMPIFFLKR